MFGNNNDDNQQQDQNQGDASVAAPAGMPAFTPPPSMPTDAMHDTTSANGDVELELPGSSSLTGGLTASQPSSDATAAPAPVTSAPYEPGASGGAALTASPNDLLRIKQEALQKLSPLVDHLEQTPEERFRTTMMMIQATDDSSMIQEAYEAADKITDEKVRAQALLDIVNEINYFSQQMNGDDSQS